MSRFRLAAVAAVFAVAATVVGPGALPAQAASCYRNTCTKVDPQAAGCSAGAVTLKDAIANNVLFELRYSKVCDAAWVRYSFVNGRGPGAGNIYLQRYITTPYGTSFWTNVSTESTAYNYSGWTDMQGGTKGDIYPVRGKLYTEGGAATGNYYTKSASI